jgi:IS605 OrfB family transposase
VQEVLVSNRPWLLQPRQSRHAQKEKLPFVAGPRFISVLDLIVVAGKGALRRYQRAMSRKVKFSKNWQKANRKVQAIHGRIGNARRDFLHKATTAISQRHAMVCVEDLQVRNLSKSAKGNAAAPGQRVRAKSGLNKSILYQGWLEFRRQLHYKLGWNGAVLVAVPAQTLPRTPAQNSRTTINILNMRSQPREYTMAQGRAIPVDP